MVLGYWASGIQVSKRIQVWKSLDYTGRAQGKEQEPLCTQAKGRSAMETTKQSFGGQGILKKKLVFDMKLSARNLHKKDRAQDNPGWENNLGNFQFPQRTWESFCKVW